MLFYLWLDPCYYIWIHQIICISFFIHNVTSCLDIRESLQSPSSVNILFKFLVMLFLILKVINLIYLMIFPD
uniref:Uncharacterized protein n=1 Tax=Rhizophora mucronata TaxID=61149 RepID=A0A2P2PVM5_RHIMU